MTAAYDPNNIFAKILRGEAPCVRLFEDEVSLAFMDIMPRADGHALIIPKAPARNLFDIAPDALARLMPSGATARPGGHEGHGGGRDFGDAVQRERGRTGRVPPAFPHPAALDAACSCGRPEARSPRPTSSSRRRRKSGRR